jgi:hypothetical protein
VLVRTTECCCRVRLCRDLGERDRRNIDVAAFPATKEQTCQQSETTALAHIVTHLQQPPVSEFFSSVLYARNNWAANISCDALRDVLLIIVCSDPRLAAGEVSSVTVRLHVAPARRRSYKSCCDAQHQSVADRRYLLTIDLIALNECRTLDWTCPASVD